jgi:hypothetical protein
MDLDALMPFGLALVSYLEGDTEATLTVRRDDGIESPIPVSHFFRAPSEFSAIENVLEPGFMLSCSRPKTSASPQLTSILAPTTSCVAGVCWTRTVLTSMTSKQARSVLC